MIKIISQKVDKLAIGLPPAALICEFLLEEEIEGNVEQFYLTVLYDELAHFSTSKESVYEYFNSDEEDLEPCDLIEEYESLEETEESKYFEYFKKADKLIDELIEKEKLS